MAAELAASTFPVTPPDDAVAMIEAALSGESPLALVDVRTEGAFRAAHIVGAVRQRQADLSSCTNSTPIAFYCQTNAASRQGAYDHLRDHPGHTPGRYRHRATAPAPGRYRRARLCHSPCTG